MFDNIKELFESKEKKEARKQLSKDIEEGKYKIVEHKGKKYACSFETPQEKYLDPVEPRLELYGDTYTIYPLDKQGKANPDKKFTMSIAGSYNADTYHINSMGSYQQSSIDKYLPLNQKYGHTDETVKNATSGGYIRLDIDVKNNAFANKENKEGYIKCVLSQHGRFSENEEIKDASFALQNAFKENKFTEEFGIPNEIFDVIAKAYPQTGLAETYTQYKEQVRTQERQSRIASTKQRLADNKEKSQEKVVENTPEQTQEQVKEPEHTEIKDNNQIETLMVNKAISNIIQND